MWHCKEKDLLIYTMNDTYEYTYSDLENTKNPIPNFSQLCRNPALLKMKRHHFEPLIMLSWQDVVM